jgi:transposase-like protein
MVRQQPRQLFVAQMEEKAMGGMRCSVCSHEARATIDKLLASGAASARAIARQYGLSKDALRRHAEAHIVRAVQGAMRRAIKREQEVGDVFTARLDAAHDSAARALKCAESEPGGWKYVAPLVGQVFRGVELLGRATGRLDSTSRDAEAGNIVNVIILPTAMPDNAAVSPLGATVIDTTAVSAPPDDEA